MDEIEKSDQSVEHRGCWFRSGEVEIHLGVEDDLHPARKAHPALIFSHDRNLLIKLKDAGIPVRRIPASLELNVAMSRMFSETDLNYSPVSHAGALVYHTRLHRTLRRETNLARTVVPGILRAARPAR
jgi:hypothetical protein